MKQTRYYRIEGNTLFVFDSPFMEMATFFSATRIDDLDWYRARFDLKQEW